MWIITLIAVSKIFIISKIEEMGIFCSVSISSCLRRQRKEKSYSKEMNTSEEQCVTWWATDVEWAEILLEKVLVPTVGGLGLLGNIVTIIVLNRSNPHDSKKSFYLLSFVNFFRPEMKSTFHQSLISLSVFEIAFLVLVILDHSLDFNSPAYIVLFPYFLHPMKNILMSCETYLIMSIARERLMAVYRPIHYRAGLLRGIHILSSYSVSRFCLFNRFICYLIFQKTGKSESGNLSR